MMASQQSASPPVETKKVPSLVEQLGAAAFRRTQRELHGPRRGPGRKTIESLHRKTVRSLESNFARYGTPFPGNRSCV